MSKHRRQEPAILAVLEELFEQNRDKSVPPFPYNKKTNTISLPHNLEEELRALVLAGDKVEAVKRVTRLTGAGLRVSKDYVDKLAKKAGPSKPPRTTPK